MKSHRTHDKAAPARRPTFIETKKEIYEMVQPPYNILQLISIFEICDRELYRVNS